jgi:cytochrome c oxidase assembly protein subunit 15
MAGIDAGKVYNTWPSMNGAIVPDGLFKLSPLWKNYFENVTLYQNLYLSE